MTWFVAVSMAGALLVGLFLVSRERSWRLGSWTRYLARSRTIEVHIGEHRTFVRVDGRSQWCENCRTSYFFVMPHYSRPRLNALVAVLCERCWRDMTPDERLHAYASWWLSARARRVARGEEVSPREFDDLRWALRAET